MTQRTADRAAPQHPPEAGQAFDLNIDRVLAHWTVPFALRELIANALDESTLTGTVDPVIEADKDGAWHIRDFGRGLRYGHLTQNESSEKRRHAGVVGQFGIGLKDALAVCDRRGVGITLRSRHGDIHTERRAKVGFDDVVTVHAIVTSPSDPDLLGTDVVLTGVTAEQVAEAKALFLRFSGETVLEDTDYGQVLERDLGARAGRVYVRGLLVATEPNFLFSYNITKLNEPLRRALNRERSNVGRTAYTDRLKKMLTAATSTAVATALTDNLSRWASGTMRDELNWKEVALHACRVMQNHKQVLFVTASQLAEGSPQLRYAEQDGYTLITIPNNLARDLRGMRDDLGRPMVDLTQYRKEWNDGFSYQFIAPENLTPAEQEVFASAAAVVALGCSRLGRRGKVAEIAVSETMRLSDEGAQVLGVWEESNRRIIVRRDQLASRAQFAGTVLHELAHAQSGEPDNSLEFEDALTVLLGRVAQKALG